MLLHAFLACFRMLDQLPPLLAAATLPCPRCCCLAAAATTNVHGSCRFPSATLSCQGWQQAHVACLWYACTTLFQPNSPADKDGRKTILIMMSNTGGGHKASAEALQQAFREEHGDKYKVCMRCQLKLQKRLCTLVSASSLEGTS